MKTQIILLVVAALGLVGCGNQAQTGGLTTEEASLVQAINTVRSQAGLKQLRLTNNLIQRARVESAEIARVDVGPDLRFREGHEHVSFLAGKARAGASFGPQLTGYWLTRSDLAKIVMMDASTIGVGVAQRSDGLLAGVVLLGN